MLSISRSCRPLRDGVSGADGDRDDAPLDGRGDQGRRLAVERHAGRGDDFRNELPLPRRAEPHAIFADRFGRETYGFGGRSLVFIRRHLGDFAAAVIQGFDRHRRPMLPPHDIPRTGRQSTADERREDHRDPLQDRAARGTIMQLGHRTPHWISFSDIAYPRGEFSEKIQRLFGAGLPTPPPPRPKVSRTAALGIWRRAPSGNPTC